MHIDALTMVLSGVDVVVEAEAFPGEAFVAAQALVAEPLSRTNSTRSSGDGDVHGRVYGVRVRGRRVCGDGDGDSNGNAAEHKLLALRMPMQ